MLVRELIAELQRVSPELEVIVDCDDQPTVGTVTIDTQETYAGFSRPTVAVLILHRRGIEVE